MRYRNCVAEGHTHTHARASLSDIPPCYSISQLGQRAFNDTKVSEYTNYLLSLLIFAITRKLCAVKAASKSFWKQSCPNVGASAITLGSRNTKRRLTDGSNKESEHFHLDLRMPDVGNFLSAE